MTTLASPTQGGSELAVWRVETFPGITGPYHAVDVEQVWTIVAGNVRFELNGESIEAGPGDTVVMPADQPRQMFTEESMTAIVAAPADMVAYNPPGHGGDGCDLAPRDDERVRPPWVA